MLSAGDQEDVELDGRNYRPKRVELSEVINKIIIVASSWLFILFCFPIYTQCSNESHI
jgi:hypothetical protein